MDEEQRAAQQTWRDAVRREGERIRAEQAAGMYPDLPPAPPPVESPMSRAAATLMPTAGQYVTLEREGRQRRGLTQEPEPDGSFVVFWVDDAGERLPGHWWSVFDAAGEPVLHGWRIVGLEPGGD